jgi:RNA polymerase-binding transcription factor DksA
MRGAANSVPGRYKMAMMKKKELKHFEDRLISERARALKELGQYGESFSETPQSSDGDLSAYSFHMADQGTDAMEREKAFDEALRRLYRDPKGFGSCEECGDEIGWERLDALPHTRLCIKCKEREESGVSL